MESGGVELGLGDLELKVDPCFHILPIGPLS